MKMCLEHPRGNISLKKEAHPCKVEGLISLTEINNDKMLLNKFTMGENQ